MDISVVIPLYNEAESLPELFDWIERVMHEHHFSHEIIFINDGSTDKSLDIIMEYAAKDSRIRFIDKPNEGISKTKEAGLNVAKGKYVLFFDNDDIIYPDALDTLFRLAQDSGADIVAVPFHLLYPDGHRENSVRLEFKETDGTDYLDRLFCDRAHWPLWANFMRMDTIRKANVDFNYRLGIGEDMVTLVQIIDAGTKVVACPVPLIDYRMREESESHKITSQFYHDYLDCLAISENLMKEKGTYWNVRQSVEKAWILRCLYGIFWGFDDTIPEDMERAKKIILRHPSAWKLMTKPMKRLMRKYMFFPKAAIRKAYRIASANNGKKYNM